MTDAGLPASVGWLAMTNAVVLSGDAAPEAAHPGGSQRVDALARFGGESPEVHNTP
jgi:hypothetical protein